MLTKLSWCRRARRVLRDLNSIHTLLYCTVLWLYCIDVLQVVNKALLACAVAPQLIHVSDTPLETLPWCSYLKMAPRTNMMQQQTVRSSVIFLKEKPMGLNFTKYLIHQSWSCCSFIISPSDASLNKLMQILSLWTQPADGTHWHISLPMTVQH